MTIPASDSEISYAGDGTTVAFPIPFVFDTSADIKVVQTDADGNPTAITTGFTIGGGGGSTGTCTFAVAPAADVDVKIYDDPAITQTASYTDNDDFAAEAHEAALDRGVRISKRLANSIENCLRVEDGDPSAGDLMLVPAKSTRAGKLLGFSASTGAPEMYLITTDAGAISPTILGLLLNPQTEAESNTDVDVQDYAIAIAPIDVRRYGILPNSLGLATINTTRIKALLDPTKNGPKGRVIFPQVNGGDTYHFNNWIDVRDDITLDLCGSRLLFTLALTTAFDLHACINGIRNVRIINGTIEVNVVSTTGTVVNAGIAVKWGSRDSYPFGSYTNGILDYDDLEALGLPPMGGCFLENMHIKSNNPSANAGMMVASLGGLMGGGDINVTYEGSGNTGPECGHYYEFGCSSKNGDPTKPAKWSSSHAVDLQFRQVRGKNLKRDTGLFDAYVVALVECSSFTVDGVHGVDVGGIFEARMGEAHFFRPWTPNNLTGLHVGTANNLTGVSSFLAGNFNSAQATASGYLSDDMMAEAGLPALTPQQKVDKQRFKVSNVDIRCASGTGLSLSAPCELNGVTVKGGSHNLIVTGECCDLIGVDVNLLDSTDINFRCDSVSAIHPRTRTINWKKGKVAGAAGFNGFSLGYIHSAKFHQVQVGYSTAKGDAANETTQLVGFNVTGTAENCEFDSCNVLTSGGALAYAGAGTSDRGNNIKSPRGTATHTANVFAIDGISRQGKSSLENVAAEINTTRKYLGKQVLETTDEILYFAQGGAAADDWKPCTGGTALLPV